MKKRVVAICILLILFCITFIVATPKLEKENDTSTLSVAEGSSIYAITVDGVKSTSFPSKGLYRVNVNCEGARGKWDYENWKLYVDDITGNVSCDISFTSISKTYLNSKIIGLSGTTQGTGQVVNENGYRYEGKNPNNYIWFNNELWRIVGVFGSSSHGQSGNLVKIVRESSLGYNYINEAYVTNNWLKAGLKRLLNVYYYRGLDGTNSGFCGLMGGGTKTCDYSGGVGLNAKSRSMIQSVRWYLGSVSNTSTDANYYQTTTANWYSYERGSTVYSGNPTYDTGYIGLLYPSDYGYSVLASSCSRSQNLSSYSVSNCVGQSWLSDQNGTWFITPASDDKNNTSIVWFAGYVSLTNNGYGYGVRPTLYLDSSVYVLDGDGSITNPYIIERDGSVTLPPEVASVSTTVTSSSVTFTTTAYQGTNAIQYYYYSVNGGSSWYSSSSSATSNTYTINGLASNTTYDLRVKILDTSGNQSNVIWPASATTLYASPTVTNVTVTGVGPTGFTINAYASSGSNSIKTYYFSTNGGSSWTSVNSSSTSYSKYFSANPSTTYSIAVKVYDTAGYVSNTYYTSATTSAYLYPSVTNVTTSNVTATSFTVTATASAGTNSLNYYYFSIDGGSSWFSANTSNTSWSMSFGAKPSTTYSIAVKVYDTAGYVSGIYYTSVSTTYMTMPAYIQSLYVGDTYNYLIYHNESGSPVYNNWGLELGDLSFRYYGANPDNYICYGTNTAPCPSDNLYRIIGVFGTQLKLIKYYSIGNYTWTGRYNADEYSYWENSYLNYGILNSNFLNNFSGNWLNWMYESRWENGGVDQPYLFYYNARTAGLYEIGPNRMYGGSYYAKVGLMYMSDYFFAADPIYWGYPGWDNNGNGNDYSLARYSNWMPTNAWTITRLADFNWFSAAVESNGRTIGYRVGNMYFDVYPVFYITDSWWYKSGSGTYSDPYMIY